MTEVVPHVAACAPGMIAIPALEDAAGQGHLVVLGSIPWAGPVRAYTER